MLKFIRSLINRLNEPVDLDRSEADVLQHPSVARMSARELADLPLRPIEKTSAGQTRCPA